jgi:hypothetical protein
VLSCKSAIVVITRQKGRCALRCYILGEMQYGRLILSRASSPVKEPVTKFGGLPVWVDQPAWPSSRSTGKPMLFIGQIVIEPELFGVPEGRMAYLFMSGGEGGETWSPDSGENAVIIQHSSVAKKPVTTDEGERLMEIYWENSVSKRRPVELAAAVVIEEEPPDLEYEEIRDWDEGSRLEYLIARHQKNRRHSGLDPSR